MIINISFGVQEILGFLLKLKLLIQN